MTLEDVIAWFAANGMTADEFIAKVNEILRKEQEDTFNAVEKVCGQGCVQK